MAMGGENNKTALHIGNLDTSVTTNYVNVNSVCATKFIIYDLHYYACIILPKLP
jgi:hypothetical protein